MGASQFIGGLVGIIALPRGDDLPQRLLFLLRAAQNAERHGALVLRIILFGTAQGRSPVVLGHRRFELPVGVADVAQTVAGVGAVPVTCGIDGEEFLERAARLRHVHTRESAVAEVVQRHGILLFAAGRTFQIGVVFGRRDRIFALRKGDFTLPEGVEGRIFGADVDRRRLGQIALRRTHVAGIVGFQSAEIGDFLQRGADVGILRRKGFDGPVGRVVIVRIVVGGDQQRAGFAYARRRGILLHIARQHVDRAVEGSAAQLILQFAVIEQRILGDRRVEAVVRGHGESVHGGPLVARPQVTVGQMIRGILRQRVLGAARPAQVFRRSAMTRSNSLRRSGTARCTSLPPFSTT